VAVFERTREPGQPVRCGCGFSNNCFTPLGIPLQDEFIINRLEGICFVTPSLFRYYNNTSVGYILKKDILISYLAAKAEQKGVRFFKNERIIKVEREKNGKYLLHSSRGKYRCEVMVDGSGFTSPVRSYLGLAAIPTLGAVRFLYPREEFEPSGVGVTSEDANYANFIFHPKILPGGYGWVFPMGRYVQVGAVCRGNPTSSLRNLLMHHGNEFQTPAEVTGGRIPCRGPVDKLVYDKILLLGESGSLVNPMNYAGNYSGMLSAKIAADAVRRYFNNKKEDGDSSIKLKEYESKLLSHPSQSPLLRRGASSLYGLTEKALDLLGKASRNRSRGGLSIMKLWLGLFRAPSVLRELGHLRELNRAMLVLWENGW
jgi:flavin-dependent dehydrogenase